MARIRLVIGSNPTHASAMRPIAKEIRTRLQANGHDVRIMTINPQNTVQYVISNYVRGKIPLGIAVRQLLEIKAPYRYLTEASMPARYEELGDVPHYIQLDAVREPATPTRINNHAHMIPVQLAHQGREKTEEEKKAGASLFKAIQEKVKSPKKARHLQDLVAEGFAHESQLRLPRELIGEHERIIENALEKIAGIVGGKTLEETRVA